MRRDRWITAFVIVWIILFHYESLRANYLNPLAGRALPKTPLLYPPAGWIMFYNVSPVYGFAEVYGFRGETPAKLDPHEIFQTWAVGYDNIRRNVLIGVLSRDRASDFCRYLRWKFPAFTAFAVVYSDYPDLMGTPERLLSQVAYRCQGTDGA